MVAVSLTSIPPRFHTLSDRLAAISDQGSSQIFLTIPDRYTRFPDWDGVVPPLPAGVTLLRGPDLGPACKFHRVFAAYPGQDVLLADDDCIYGPGWLAAFQAARDQHPNSVIAASTFCTSRLGLAAEYKVFQGFAGVLLRPEWLGVEALDIDPVAQWVDDIWLSAHAARAGVSIVDCSAARELVLPNDAPMALQTAVVDGKSRAVLNSEVAQRLSAQFQIW